jgi:GntR family transcriptional regulator/MocR family aminotransferase
LEKGHFFNILWATLRRPSLTLVLEPGSGLPRSVQIARALGDTIRQGRLRAGSPLPGTRTLATQLGVSRNTVFAAYQELAAEGLITARQGQGSVVAEGLPSPEQNEFTRASGNEVGFDLQPLAQSAVTAVTLPPGGMRWDFGVPDVRLAPIRELARAYRRVLRSSSRLTLQYNRYRRDPSVPSPLRVGLAGLLGSTRALSVRPEDLVLTAGSQMALYLLARALLRPGDRVAVEEPGYSGAWELFTAVGAEVVSVPIDKDGLRIDALEAAAQKAPLRAVLVTPHHQFPTTVTLPMGRRLELLRLASTLRFAVLEDDYDHEFHYDGRPLMPLASMDGKGVVAYIGSLSKILAPGLRAGYVVAPQKLATQLSQWRGLIDIQGDQTLEQALAELLEEGELQRHWARARRIYRARRDALVVSLRRELGGALEFEVPPGGLALWVRVDPAIDVEAWAERAARLGLFFRTGKIFYRQPQPLPFMRLGFALLDEQERREALSRLVRSMPRPARAGR